MSRRICVSLVAVLCLMIGLTSVVTAADQPAPVQNAINVLAQKLNIPAGDVEVVSVQGVAWPDTSLGCPQPGHMYAQVITQGYKVVLAAKGKRYEYHTNMERRAVLASIDGKAVLEEGTGTRQPRRDDTPAIAETCRENLAKRLGIAVDEIGVSRVEAVEFPDTSLGLPRPGEMYAQVLTGGYVIHLIANNRPYLYTAGNTACRYAGPLHAARYSALYLEPVENEPNLNGNLVQVSLTGTNPSVLLTGASDFRPQHDGSMLATRRTSRSGFDLVYLPPGTTEAVKLASVFAFGDAAINQEGTKWVAFSRPMVGGGWQVSWGSLAGGAETPGHVDLPADSKPGRIYWHMTNPAVALQQGNGLIYYELVPNGDKPEWRKLEGFSPPPTEEFMLNKSETLVVRTEQDAGKPVTQVTRRWFTGEDKPVATIANFEPKEKALTPDKRFLLLSGEDLALTVDIATGEVLTTAQGMRGPVRLLLAPPRGWLWRHLAEQKREE